VKTTSGNVRKVDIDREVQQSYLDYAMSVIVARALPDARDGMKPVQRRILYAMHDMHLSPTVPFKKSARIVGEVLGKYHPHGDMTVYESMARMAQDFTMRYPLVNGQGNFGSVDGDPPAAMRYTEARLTALSGEMLTDLEKETVAFLPNFDGDLTEPDVLPAAVPNLLVNGATGIAVGMATSIPPHNLGEVCDALVHMLKAWKRMEDISVGELTKHIKGPDFPTGGLVLDPPGSEEGLAAAYGTGRGRVTVRARVHLEEASRGRSRILITELPYQVNKSALLERIADLVRNGTIEGIADLRDESDRRGMRVVIELKSTADAPAVLRDLFKRTPMETTFSIHILALVRGEPRMLSLKQALRVFLDHRLDVIRKRSVYDLARAEERAHILEGLRVALRHLEEVIRLIRGSKNAEEARRKLQKRFRLTILQADAILDMPLRRLAALEREKIELEYKEKLALIARLKKLLASPKLQREALAEELIRVKKTYADSRRSVIVSGWEEMKAGKAAREESVPAEDTWIVLLRTGEISRIDGSKPPLEFGQAAPRFILKATTQDTLYLFTEKGRGASIPVHAIPARESPEGGVHFSTVCALEAPSRVVTGLVVSAGEEGDARCVLLATRMGMVKKTPVKDLPASASQVFPAMKVGSEDSIGWTAILGGKNDLLMITSSGMSIRFSEKDVRPMGWVAGGVLGIRMEKAEDRVVAVLAPDTKQDILLVSETGHAKRVPFRQYGLQGRYGIGTATWKSAGKPTILDACAGGEADRLILVTKEGPVRTVAFTDVPRKPKAAAGKRLAGLKAKDTLVKTLGVPGVIRKKKAKKVRSVKSRKSPAKKKNAGRRKRK
jgi:DNA gyrase subunit A